MKLASYDLVAVFTAVALAGSCWRSISSQVRHTHCCDAANVTEEVIQGASFTWTATMLSPQLDPITQTRDQPAICCACNLY